ncbi:MAG: amino acid transporter [Alphaproteobacteria bacterium]|nr:amino acid transporter [Alphaproteobacteria bacterium]
MIALDNFCAAPFWEGCATGAGLIIAIGAQNAFVLKQGIMKNHVFATVFICCLVDAILIALGVGGFGTFLTSSPFLLSVAKWGGVGFLVLYGLRSFGAVLKTEALAVEGGRERPNLKASILMILAFSLLNPHVYLDAVLLLGSIGAQLPKDERPFFALGAIVVSFVWFFSMGYGARFLAPLFAKPLAWKILDMVTGAIMLLLAYLLAMGSLGGVC